MKKQINFILSILVIFTFLISSNVVASAEKLADFAKQAAGSVGSVGSVASKVLPKIEGTVRLIIPKKITKAPSSISSVLQGSDKVKKIRKKKVIKVEGVLDGETLTVAGEDRNGGSYLFKLNAPFETVPEDFKKFKLKNANFPSIGFTPKKITQASITGSVGSIKSIAYKSNVVTVTKNKKGETTYKGKFSKKIKNAGNAKGRFVLKLSSE